MQTLLITYSQVEELLITQGHLRQRQARRMIAAEAVPPVRHGLHGRRLWLRQAVLDFCADLQKGAVPLGKGALGAVASTATANVPTC